jgi:hypothetical protein
MQAYASDALAIVSLALFLAFIWNVAAILGGA